MTVGKFRIGFWHDNSYRAPHNRPPVYPLNFQHAPNLAGAFTAMTIAVARNCKDNNPIAFGAAYCSVKDRFCKATGRKIAFTRLLKSLNLSKEERRAAWIDYHSKFPF